MIPPTALVPVPAPQATLVRRAGRSCASTSLRHTARGTTFRSASAARSPNRLCAALACRARITVRRTRGGNRSPCCTYSRALAKRSYTALPSEGSPRATASCRASPVPISTPDPSPRSIEDCQRAMEAGLSSASRPAPAPAPASASASVTAPVYLSTASKATVSAGSCTGERARRLAGAIASTNKARRPSCIRASFALVATSMPSRPRKNRRPPAAAIYASASSDAAAAAADNSDRAASSGMPSSSSALPSPVSPLSGSLLSSVPADFEVLLLSASASKLALRCASSALLRMIWVAS